MTQIIPKTDRFKRLRPFLRPYLESRGIDCSTKEILCPVHDEKTPSAQLNEDTLKCYVCGEKPWDVVDLHCKLEGCSKGDALKTLEHQFNLAQLRNERSRIVATFDYRDGSGTLVYQSVRWEPGFYGRSKSFTLRRPWGEGKWAWGLTAGIYVLDDQGDLKKHKKGDTGWTEELHEVETILYRLPELIASPDPVFVVEGEKCCEAVRAFGLTSTTNPMGAGKWEPHYAKSLTGRQVIILPDSDEPGRKHAREVAAALIADRPRILELPDLQPKEDVADWISRGGTREQLLALADTTEVLTEYVLEEMKPERGTTEAGMDDVLTEIGMARRFLDEFSGTVLSVHADGDWYIWDNTRWRRDKLGRVLNMMTRLTRSHADEVEPGQEKKARKLEKASCIRAALALASADPRVSVERTVFDTHVWLLNVRNGTIDLSSGAIREHDRADLLTEVLDIDYVPEAKCPRFDRFLEECLLDPEVREYVLLWLGYCLTGIDREHALTMFVGTGRNGKGALIRIVQNIMGDLADVAPESLFVVRRNEQHPTELEVLRGKRLIVASELPKSSVFNEARVKQLVGGDQYTARGMGKDFTKIKNPTHKLLIQCNHMPHVVDDSEGFWERVRVVRFEVSFAGREDRSLDEKLRAEREGIFAKLVAAAARWAQGGLTKPAAVVRATSEYRSTEDTLATFAAFLREDRGVARVENVPIADLFVAYTSWAEEVGAREINKNTLAKRLSERKWTKERRRASDGTRFAVWSEPKVDHDTASSSIVVHDVVHDQKPIFADEKAPTTPLDHEDVTSRETPQHAHAPAHARAPAMAKLPDVVVHVGHVVQDDPEDRPASSTAAQTDDITDLAALFREAEAADRKVSDLRREHDIPMGPLDAGAITLLRNSLKTAGVAKQ